MAWCSFFKIMVTQLPLLQTTDFIIIIILYNSLYLLFMYYYR